MRGAAARPAHAPSPRDRALVRSLDRIVDAPGFQQGFWGVYVYSLDRKRVLYNHNGDRWFTPASNAKLFTLAAALHLLGPEFRLHTTLQASVPPDDAGVIAGDLSLVGVGDPSFSGRTYPYVNDPATPQLPFDPGKVPRVLAQQLVARGVKRITGDIVGDDSYFDFDPYPDGWAIGDEMWDYGAPVSALTLNDNTRFLQIFPGAAPGAAPRLVWAPAADPPKLRDLAATTAAGGRTRLRLREDAATGELVLEGGIAADSPGELQALAVRHPARYAAELLRQALLDAGVVVEGQARARHAPAPGAGYVLWQWDSPPLAESLQVTAKISQNLEAELMLRLLGKLRGAGASGGSEAAAGEAVVGIAPDGDRPDGFLSFLSHHPEAVWLS
ncbi:MAG: D-alanyl-D-alanine carboxypeptidase/D-alanyl-D-alanine endopeptidase, partial [Terriglobales bacterium]